MNFILSRRIKIERFHLYTGLGGDFGGAHYNQTIEAKDIDEAYECAYKLAVEEYHSYEGLHGIMDWGDCYEDLVESGFIDEKSMTEDEIHDYVDARYQEEIEGWTEYYAVKNEGQDPESC